MWLYGATLLKEHFHQTISPAILSKAKCRAMKNEKCEYMLWDLHDWKDYTNLYERIELGTTTQE